MFRNAYRSIASVAQRRREIKLSGSGSGSVCDGVSTVSMKREWFRNEEKASKLD
jgi:hypothetical protein